MGTVSKLRFGILGAARIAPMALLRPARKLAEVEIVAVAARDPARAARFARRHRIPRVHGSYADLLADPEIDAIYNPLPNALHCPWTLRALRAGKHVLCEKPIASNAAEAEEMAQTAGETGRLLVEAFHYRHHPLATRLREILDRGDLGRLEHAEAWMCIPLLRPGDIRYSQALAGGATMDVGCYVIHLLRFLMQAEPEVVWARARLASAGVDRWMRAELRFPSGRTGAFTCSLLSTRLLSLGARVRGSEGELRILNPFAPHLYHRLRVRGSRGSFVERVPGEASYTHQLRAFTAAVLTGEPLPLDPADAVANMRVIDAVYRRAGMSPRADRTGPGASPGPAPGETVAG